MAPFAEEPWLREQLGPGFDEYAAVVPRFFDWRRAISGRAVWREAAEEVLVARDSSASVSVRRVVPATPDRVFAAFTIPSEIEKWHAPGPDFSVCIAEVDLRVGGKYRIGMQPPDRDAPHTFYGVYREISPPSRLVYSSNWEPPDRDTGETRVMIELRDAGGSTEVCVTHEGLPDPQSAEDHTRGWTGTLESLARHFR
jgi:uncharacterized protein YndB with AHSA1/START domain